MQSMRYQSDTSPAEVKCDASLTQFREAAE